MNYNKDDITLDNSIEEFERLLERASRLILNTYADLDDRKVFNKRSPADIFSDFEESMPLEPISQQQLMDIVEHKIVKNATLSCGPNFYSYVLSPGNQVGLAGELISTFLNQNTSKWHLGPAASEIEKITLSWIAEFIGYSSYSGGIFVSGGSMANLTCLTVARNVKSSVDINQIGLYQQAPMIVYLTDQAHYCVDKAIGIIGLGKQHLRRIPTTKKLEMDTVALETAILEDVRAGFKPFCVVASAGTVNTGAIDPLNQIADVCEKFDLWFHIDAAYGGPAASLDTHKQAFNGLHRAHSVALDPHKWLYVPIEAGCALFRDDHTQKETYSIVPEYLKVDRSVDQNRIDFMEFGPQLTRSFRALKVWMTFKAFGAAKLRTTIAHDIAKAQYLANRLHSHNYFEVFGPVPLSIVCFRFKPPQANLSEEMLDDLNVRILHDLEEDGSVFITGTTIEDRTALRACIVNHRTQLRHVDKLIEKVMEIAEKLSIEL